MRSEPHRPKAFRISPAWLHDEGMTITVPAAEDSGLVQRSHSFSGNERNRLFLNLAGQDFSRLSLLSGLDKKEDGRSWAKVDIDGDGWQDIILAGPQHPRFRIYRNCLGDFLPKNRSLSLRLMGGNETADPSPWSSRTPYGASVSIEFAGQTRRLQLASSEGMAAQNENRLFLGLGSATGPLKLHVTWPSGRQTKATLPIQDSIPRTLIIRERKQN